MAVLVAIGMSIWRSRQSKLVTTYGSARWANADDVRQAGLIQSAGVFLGQLDGQYLRHEGPEHVLTFAPTRSGKGVGLVVPTLLSWPASAVIHDIKGENWQITAGWRSRFSHCLLFNPTDAKSAAYNPLLEVRRGAHEVRDVQNIADILVDPKARWRSATIGKRPRTRCWSGPSCMCSTRAKTRRCAASPTFCPTRPARSS
ncbi:conjugal transfer protein [Klebsiella pneumoniae]|uniref:Conjugal transfer protein n=1 Tax=Klebsiella pneumoniae TaxID=573 RepID=A0A378A147_KLEPN|nr:conjugal transfer protein [Klebsiella pneumoniae]